VALEEGKHSGPVLLTRVLDRRAATTGSLGVLSDLYKMGGRQELGALADTVNRSRGKGGGTRRISEDGAGVNVCYCTIC
jgi:hypothetical protein